MGEKGYTDDEVRAAVNAFRGMPVVMNTHTCNLFRLVWAASQYLKAKAVIEWYGDADLYRSFYDPCGELTSNAEADNGAKAREYLEKLNQNKGE